MYEKLWGISTSIRFHVPVDEITALRKFSETQILQQSHASASLILQTLYGLTRSEEDLLRAAVQARLSGNWTAAQCLFQEIFASFGQKYGSCMEGGLCELAMGNNIQAEELFAAAYQINQNAHAILWRGVALRRLGKYEEALDSLKLALRLDASLPSIHNEIGQCFEALGNYRSAIQSYRDFPTNGSPESRTFALNRLGLCYLKIDDSNALSALLDSQIYREHMNTSYAIASYVLWCLHLHRQVDDEYIISREQKLTADGAKQPMFDALTLHLAKNIPQGNHIFERYRKLFDSDYYGKAAFAVTSEFTLAAISAELENIMISQTDRLVQIISSRVRDGAPFSMIRLGDGEGNFLAGYANVKNSFLMSHAEKILRHWFGNAAADILAYGELYEHMEDAVREADIIGIPNIERLKIEVAGEPRGYWGAYMAAHYACNLPGDREFCDASAHIHLFSNPKFVSALRNARELHTISCHMRLGEILRSRLDIEHGVDMVVPGEMSNEGLPAESKEGVHYPNRYREILREIGYLRSGGVVLIAAGVCGKAYAGAARRAGLIALDIGAMADHMMGFATRRVFSEKGVREVINKSWEYRWGGGAAGSRATEG